MNIDGHIDEVRVQGPREAAFENTVAIGGTQPRRAPNMGPETSRSPHIFIFSTDAMRPAGVAKEGRCGRLQPLIRGNVRDVSFTPAGGSARGLTLRATRQPDVVTPLPTTCTPGPLGARRSAERPPPDQLAQKGTHTRDTQTARAWRAAK